MIRIPGNISPAKPLVVALALVGSLPMHVNAAVCETGYTVDSTPGNDTEATTTLDEALAAYESGTINCTDQPVTITITDSLAGQTINTENTTLSVYDGEDLTITGNAANPPVLESMGSDGQRFFSANESGKLTLRNLVFNATNVETAQESNPLAAGSNAELNLENITARGFYTSSEGGALASINATVTISDSIFENNRSTSSGGAIQFSGSTDKLLTVKNSTFTGNAVKDDYASVIRGGAIAITGANNQQHVITDNIFTGHHLETVNNGEATMSAEGGAIYMDGQSGIILDGNTFIDNSVTTSGTPMSHAKGGALYIETPDPIVFTVLSIFRNSFQDNQALVGQYSYAQASGGAAQMGGAALSGFGNNTFIGNHADNVGGAIAMEAPTGSGEFITIQNTFSHNSSADGGGALFVSANEPIGGLLVAHNTFVSNTASLSGAAAMHLDSISSEAGATEVHHNAFAYNGAAEGSEAEIPVLCNSNTDEPLTLSYNFLDIPPSSACSAVGDTDGGANQIGTLENPLDPGLKDLGMYGGPTLTYLPKPGSPLLDAGDPNYDTEEVPITEFDQRGKARVFNGVMDLGAVERGNEPENAITVPGTGSGGGGASWIWLGLLGLLGLRQKR